MPTGYRGQKGPPRETGRSHRLGRRWGRRIFISGAYIRQSFHRSRLDFYVQRMILFFRPTYCHSAIADERANRSGRHSGLPWWLRLHQWQRQEKPSIQLCGGRGCARAGDPPGARRIYLDGTQRGAARDGRSEGSTGKVSGSTRGLTFPLRNKQRSLLGLPARGYAGCHAASRAALSRPVSSSVWAGVMTRVVRHPPSSVSHILPSRPKPLLVTMAVTTSPSGLWATMVARNDSSSLPLRQDQRRPRW